MNGYASKASGRKERTMPAHEAYETSPGTADLTLRRDPMGVLRRRRWLPHEIVMAGGIVVCLSLIGLVVADLMGLWPR
jgi:hypothetical protein